MTMLSDALGEQKVSMDRLRKEIDKAWRKSRPKLMEQYDAAEQTEAEVTAAAERWWDTMNDLQRQGVPHDQADNLARYEWIYLPDIDQEDS